MAEYIEREAAYQTLTEYYHHTTEGMHSALREAISRVPAADVRPVVRGRWIKNTYECARELWDAETKCSLCGYTLGGATPNYCPNCGADMRNAND